VTVSGFINAALSRRALIGVAVVAAALFTLAAMIAAIYGNPPDNDAIDLVGAVAWFGWMIAVISLVVLSVAAIIRRSAAARKTAAG
jgi:heme/copper-type cytochrome/quinol oxidase subunit 2